MSVALINHFLTILLPKQESRAIPVYLRRSLAIVRTKGYDLYWNFIYSTSFVQLLFFWPSYNSLMFASLLKVARIAVCIRYARDERLDDQLVCEKGQGRKSDRF